METFSLNETNLHLKTHLLLAGAHCALRSNSLDVIASVATWRCPAVPAGDRSFEMRIFVDPAPGKTLPSPFFRGIQHLVFAAFGERDLFTIDLRNRRVIGVITRETAHRYEFWKKELLPIVIGILGTSLGVVPIHSACLEMDGRGLLLVGPSGVGKSTLAAALTRCGFSLVSDDWTYISEEDGALSARGFSRSLKLLPDTMQYFPELCGHSLTRFLNGELAYEVHPAKTFGCRIVADAVPRWLLHLDRASFDGYRFGEIDGKDVVDYCERTSERLPPLLTRAKSARSQVFRALSRCDCWSFKFGGSPQHAAETVRDFLKEQMRPVIQNGR